MFSECVVITSNFAQYACRILTLIYDSHVFGNAKLNNWKPCRANPIDATEEYAITGFTIPLQKMNFSVVNTPQIKLESIA